MSELERVGDHIRRRVRLPSVDPLVLEARRVWAEAVGEQVARNALPVRRNGDTLVVHCASSTWAGELTMLERQMLEGLRRRLGGLPAALRFEVGAVVQEEVQAAPGPPLPEATPEQRARAATLTASVPDGDLADRIREAAELSFRRGS